ncbi:MAG TPA: hypothetical protein VMM27_16340 [Casimicrobiaceae bacterium]|nr:hypothetical protein [Casimicrobiaceae bacterium]
MKTPQPHHASSDDREAVQFVAASVEELRYAHELRERLRRMFPNRPAAPAPIWSVGAD